MTLSNIYWIIPKIELMKCPLTFYMGTFFVLTRISVLLLNNAFIILFSLLLLFLRNCLTFFKSEGKATNTFFESSKLI